VTDTQVVEHEAVEEVPAPPTTAEPGGLSDEALEARGEAYGANVTVVEQQPEEAPVEDEAGGDVELHPQLKDLGAAKKAYDEARRWGNNLQNENAQLKAQLEALQTVAAPVGYEDDEPSYDPAAFDQIVQEDAQQAFSYALEAGSEPDALQAIAQVQSDAQLLASKAALYEQDGDMQNASLHAMWARNANAQAAQMNAALFNAKQQAVAAQIDERVQPLRDRAQLSEFNIAADMVRRHVNGDTDNYRERIGEIVQEVPGLLGDGSRDAMAQGFFKAYQLAKAEAFTGGTMDFEKTITDKVAEAVAAAVEGTRKRKAANADAHQAEGAGMANPFDAPVGLTGDAAEADALKQSVYGEAAKGPIGVNGFFAL